MPAAPGVRQIKTPTAGEMHAEVMRRLPDTDILIMAAAVADYRVAQGPAGGKISKGSGELAIGLEPTTDILCDVSAHHRGQFLVGFAAEYGLEGLGRAKEKMERKQLDMIVFNDISRTDIGFDSDFNEVYVLTRDGEMRLERAPKETIAELILDHIAQAVRARRRGDAASRPTKSR